MTARGALAAALALLPIVAASACTTSASPGHAARRTASPAPATSTSPPATLAPRGRPGCHPASPTDGSASHFAEVEGTGHGVSLWGLLFFPGTRAQTGKQEKIVWRMTGSGPIRLSAISPAGQRHRLAWGPTLHGSSSWDRPGAEWGAGYYFTSPGCWDLHAARGKLTADAWLEVT
jgi:hypothetical protein